VKRKYELKKRAERQEETKRRIIEAAVELHGTVGPARTTFSDVARRAGVQRHTLYRYFPDERALFLACSGHFAELVPLPDPEAWTAIREPERRLRHALNELYGYFERAEPMLTNVIRDAEIHATTREIAALRRAPHERRRREILARGIRGRRRLALLDLVLEFHTWRRLAQASGFTRDEAVDVAVSLVFPS
jgi:AcrR family transcriptional regulator